MKILIFIVTLFFFGIGLCYSQSIENCKTEYIYPTLIHAGQESGCGIRYINILPDDTLLVNPSNLDTSITYDLDGNNISDFKLTYSISSPFMLGGGYSNFYITPLGSNSVCASSIHSNLADSLSYNSIIDSTKTWSNLKADLYNTYWTMAHIDDTTYGYWKYPKSYYVGVRINNAGVYHYGWIAVNYSHIVSKYAVTIQYSHSDIAMTNPNTAVINSGEHLNINLTCNVLTSYTWVASNNPNTVGESTTVQTTNIINDTIENITDSIQFVTYIVTPLETECNGQAFPQTITVKVIPSVGINENYVNRKISIFPNPFSAETTIIKADEFLNSTLTIYNYLGQQIQKLANIFGPSITLSRETFPDGIYFICIEQKNEILLKSKLVITH
jgi:hypothetical protein